MSRESLRARLVWEILTACAAWTLGVLVFRWDVISTGFREISSPAGDGRALIFLLEHWLEVFQGRAVWRDPGQYFPEPGTLGYYDAHFLQAMLYVPLRLLGIERFLAFQVEQLLMTAIGFAGFWLFARTVLRAPVPVTLFGSLLFMTASSLHASTPQAQLFSLYFVPWLGLALALGWRRVDSSPGSSFAWGAAAGLGYALLLYTSFYIGWLLAIAAVVLAGCWALVAPGAVGRLVVGRWRRLLPLALGGSLGGLAGIVPFALTHFPIVAAGRSRELSDAMHSLGRWTDVVNVGVENLMWGPLLRALPGYPVARLQDPNLYRTITPLVLATVLVGGCVAFVKGLRTRTPFPPERRALVVLALTVLVLLVLPMCLGGHSVWPWIWRWVPGGKAVRFPWRLEIVNAGIAAVAVTLVLTLLFRRNATPSRLDPKAVAAALLLGGLLVTEQVSRADWAPLDRRAEIAMLEAIPPPPKECRAFAMVDDVGVVGVPNGFALLVAQQVRLPTMNGLEGPLYPDPRVEIVDRETLLLRARNVLERFGWPPGVCVFDLPTRSWDTESLAGRSWPEVPIGARLDLGRGGQTRLLASGWSFPEDWGTWSEGSRSLLRFRVPADAADSVGVCARVRGFVVPGSHDRQETVVTVRDREVARWVFEAGGWRTEAITVPRELVQPGGLVELTLTHLDPVSPRELGLNVDARELGMSVSWIRVVEGRSACRISARDFESGDLSGWSKSVPALWPP